jgi:large repetitive protein
VPIQTTTDLSITKSTSAPIAFGNNPITYTLAVSNLGPAQATSISVSDTLPAGAGFVSASGAGWTCGAAAGVTCTRSTLAVGAAPPISLVMNGPPVASPGTLSNTASVTISNDPTPGNNSSTSTVPIRPTADIPALNAWMLMLLAAALGLVALVRRT